LARLPFNTYAVALAGFYEYDADHRLFKGARGMDLSALIKAVLAPMEPQISGDALRDLKPGDKLTGRVLNIESDGRALVDLGRSRVLAQIAFAVKAGEPLNLQVVENETVLHLRAERLQTAGARAPVPIIDFFEVLTPVQQEQLSQIAGRLTAPSVGSVPPAEVLPREVLQAASRLNTLFENVPLDQSSNKLAAWIKGATEDRGVFFEKHLADMVSDTSSQRSGQAEPGRESPDALIARDIKPQLMILKNFLDQAGDSQQIVSRLNPKETELLRHCVERLLNHVSEQQAHAVTRWESGAPQQVLVHLWPLQEQRAPVRLKIYYPPKNRGGGDQRHHRIAILLDMNRLGPVRADLTMIGGNLHIGFYVASQALKENFQKELHSVETALAGKFQQLQLDVFVSREKIQRFDLEDLDVTATGGVDINA
jgi:hypothetical protein